MKLQVIDNVLSQEVFLSTVEHSNFVYQNYTLQSSTSFWNSKIVEFSKPVLVYELLEKDPLFLKIKKEVENLKNTSVVLGILFYFWTPGSYIPWHNDGQAFTNALTIYLNEEWWYNYGGLFQYLNGDKVESVTPRSNLGVLQVGNVQHSTTITSIHAPVRKTVQIFFKDPKDDSTKSPI